MQIATWNVNSLRVRLPQVLDWLRAAQPDVVALQEIKCRDAEVPASAFAALGYQVVSSGQKTYNGVAMLARAPLRDRVVDLPTRVDPQRRLLAATIDGLRVTTGCSASRCAAAAGAAGSTSRRGATSGRRTMLRCSRTSPSLGAGEEIRGATWGVKMISSALMLPSHDRRS